MKKVLALILTLSMVFVLAACAQEAAPAASDDAAAKPETRTVVDVWQREIEIPATIESIVCLGSGAPRIAAYLGAMDMLVGVEEVDAAGMTVLRDYSPVHFEAIKNLPVVGAGGGSGSNNAYPEELITIAPDVILAGFSAEAADELQQQTGIPVISVRYISKGLANESFYEAMRVFAQVIGAEERCEELLAFIDSCKAELNNRTAEIDDAQKPLAYTGAVTFSGVHGFTGTYSQFGPFDAINAINVADVAEQDGYYETDFEKILAWDPDIIFLDPANMHIVNDEFATNPGYFDAIRAVQENKVYTMPSFNYAGMNMTYALMNAYYAGIVMFPEAFSDVDIEQKSAEILMIFLGENIYDVMAENGLYYGTITIGD